MFASPIKKSNFRNRIESTQNLSKEEYNQLYNAPHNIPLKESPSPRKSGSFDPISLNLFEAPYKKNKPSNYNSKEQDKNFSPKKHLLTSNYSTMKRSNRKTSFSKSHNFSNKQRKSKNMDFDDQDPGSLDENWIIDDDELDEEPIEQEQPKIPYNKPLTPVKNPVRRSSSYLDNFIRPPKDKQNRRISMNSSKSSSTFGGNNNPKIFIEPEKYEKELQASNEKEDNRRLSSASSSILDNFLLSNAKKKMKKPLSKPILRSSKKESFSEYVKKSYEPIIENESEEEYSTIRDLHDQEKTQKVRIPQAGKMTELRRIPTENLITKKSINNFLLAIEIQRLNKVLGDMDKAVVKKDSKIENLREQISEKELEKSTIVTKDIEVLKLELRSLAERNRQLNLKNKDLQIKNEQLRSNKGTNTLRETFENNVSSLKNSLEEAHTEIENLHSRNDDLQNQLEIRENEVTTLKQIMQDYHEHELSFKRKSNRPSNRGGKINSSKNVIFFINFLNDLYITVAGILRMCDKTEEKNVAKYLFDNLNELKDDENKLRSDFSDNLKRKLRKEHNYVNDALKEIKKLAASKYHKGRREGSMSRNKDLMKERNEYKTKYEILLKKFGDLEKDYELLKRREPTTVKRVNPISMAITPNKISTEVPVLGSRNLLRTFDNQNARISHSRSSYNDFQKTPKGNLRTVVYQVSPSPTRQMTYNLPHENRESLNVIPPKNVYKSGQNSVLTVSNLPQNSHNFKHQMRLPLGSNLNTSNIDGTRPFTDPSLFGARSKENSFRANSFNDSLFKHDSKLRKDNKLGSMKGSHRSKENISSKRSNWDIFENDELPSQREEMISEVMITTENNETEHILSMRLSGVL